MRSFRFAFCALFLTFLPSALQAQSVPSTKNPAACAERLRADRAVVHGFTFSTYQNGDNSPACLTVRRQGQIVYRAVNNEKAFSLGQPSQPDYGVPAITNGSDLTGRGNPDMIVTSFSGGAHCCTDLLLFELEPTFQLLATLHLGNRDLGHFAKDPADHKYYFYGADDAFAYWHTSFAQSPAPPVILEWIVDSSHHGEFRLALTRMKGSQPTAKQWEQHYLQTARVAFQPDEAFADPETGPYLVGPGLWSTMLDLIYSERSPLAWKLLEEVWPSSKPGKATFLADLCHELTQSKFWSDLQPTLTDPPQSCSAALSSQPKQ